MATVRIFRSTDASAPVLTGAADSLNALLKACLVNGYGTHSPLGWTNPYNDTTNKIAVFRQGAGSSGMYLRVNDNGPNATSTYKEARVVAFESVVGSQYTDGTAPFPTSTQSSRTGVTGDNAPTTSGLVWRKSATADSTARPWILIGNETLFYLFIQTGDSTVLHLPYCFGDIYSYKAADAYKALLTGRTTENSAASGADFPSIAESGALGGHYMARSYTGAGSSIAIGKCTDTTGMGAPQTCFSGTTSAVPYPNPADGALLLARVHVYEPAICRRGFLPGVWSSLHNNPLVGGDTISGSGGLSGKSYEVVSLFGATASQLYMETSNTWEVS